MVEEIKLACPTLLRRAVVVGGGQENAGYVLLGSRCKQCGEIYFPARSACTRCCATDSEEIELGNRGHLWSWTIQGFLPKLPYNSGETEQSFKPYGVGYVEMPSGIKIESRLTVADPAQLQIGMPMQLTLDPYRVTADGDRVFTFAFAPQTMERNPHEQ